MFLLLCSNAFAQLGDDYKPKVDSVFMNLDKSPNRIPTGILYEAGYSLIEENRLNGNATQPVDLQTWKTFYYSLFTGKVNSANPIPQLDGIETTIAQLPTKEVSIPILRMNYNTVNRDAFDTGCLSIVNEQLFDGNVGMLYGNEDCIPYDTKPSFAVTLTQQETKTGKADFFFNPALFFTNVPGLSIKKIEASFDNGSLGTYILGSTAKITWTTGGIKHFFFRITFTDGSVMKCNRHLS